MYKVDRSFIKFILIFLLKQMLDICKGCGEDMNFMRCDMSQFGHGKICYFCAKVENFEGDFITKYSDRYSMEYPVSYLTKLYGKENS